MNIDADRRSSVPEEIPDAIPVNDYLGAIARRDFGLEYLFPYQRLVVTNVLEAFDLPNIAASKGRPGSRNDGVDSVGRQLVILPTGAGKSLCFQLPAPLLPGITVVVFPLLSLISDQARRMSEQGLRPVVLRGGQSPAEREAVWRAIRAGRSRIVLTNPESLLDRATVERLCDTGISHLVIDEAHCVAEWGDTFRPVYRDLHRVVSATGVPLVTAFTATASPVVLERICYHLFPEGGVHLIEANPDRPNISYRVIPCISKTHALVKLLAPRTHPADFVPVGSHPPLYPAYIPARRPAIVFCRSRDGAELTAQMLRERLGETGIFFYHAGLTREEKQRVEGWFFESENGILSATCAYGMGVDKKDIRTVIHYEPPGSVEAYLQESGRGGRDRSHAEAVLLAGPEDIVPEVATAATRRAAHGSETGDGAAATTGDRSTAGTDPVADRPGYDPTQVQRSRLLHMLGYAASDECRRTYLLRLLGHQPEACFGCDVCSGFAVRKPAGEEEILSLLRRFPRTLTPREAAKVLSGDRDDAEARSRDLDRFARYTLLPDWDAPDVEEAIRTLIDAGRLRRYRRGPWKRLLRRPARSRSPRGR